MSSIRLTISVLFVFALLFTAAEGRCAEQDGIDWQIAERTKQYRETLRQRASQLSPSLQAKIENQAEQTVAKCTAKWQNGEVALRIALPRLAEAKIAVRLLARHLPFSGAPFGAFAWKASICDAVLTVTSVQSVLKSFAISVVNSAAVRRFAGKSQRNNDGTSCFIRIVCTIVQRR